MSNKLSYRQALKAIKKDWYFQGINARPLFLCAAGNSGFKAMKKGLGFNYSVLIYNYEDGYGEMGYLFSDFVKIWHQVKNRLKQDKNYLEKIKKLDKKNFSVYHDLFLYLDQANIKKISDDDLLVILKKLGRAQIDCVGVAHVIEAIAAGVEKEFREKLFEHLRDKSEFNRLYIKLTAPTKLSFIAEEEQVLDTIKRLVGAKRKRALKNHLRRFFWVENSYLGPRRLTISMLEKKLKTIAGNKINNNSPKKKSIIIKKLDLKNDIIELINLIDFSTIWQDERKANILRTINYLGTAMEEVARRIGLDKLLLFNLVGSDYNKIKNLHELKTTAKELKIRTQFGAFILQTIHGEKVLSGQGYKRLEKVKGKINRADKSFSINEIRGSIANGGTAIGRAIICKGINSLNRVRKGDIIVTSMTRPEYMPALRKAAAIVTDDGGITSHAAIIARELGIPAVIGTKVATKIIKDGSLIEVRANHGLVKLL